MSTEQQARALMMRHHHAVKNRQHFSSQTYDRSGATLS